MMQTIMRGNRYSAIETGLKVVSLFIAEWRRVESSIQDRQIYRIYYCSCLVNPTFELPIKHIIIIIIIILFIIIIFFCLEGYSGETCQGKLLSRVKSHLLS